MKPYLIKGFKTKRWSDLRWSETFPMESKVSTRPKKDEEDELLKCLKSEDEDILDVKIITSEVFNN